MVLKSTGEKVSAGKAAKKVPAKKAAKNAPAKKVAKNSPLAEKTGQPSVPSYILRLEQANPEGFSYLAIANMAWGLSWRPDCLGPNHRIIRQPLFTFTGNHGIRWKSFVSRVSDGRHLLDLVIASEKDRLSNREESEQDDFNNLIGLASHSCHHHAMLHWISLWGLDDLSWLDEMATYDDTVAGDLEFLAWVELLIMVDEVAGLFRGTNSDIWGHLEGASWLTPRGQGLVLLKYIRGAARQDFDCFNAPDPTSIYSKSNFAEVEGVLVELRKRVGAVFAKVLEVLQSPAMEARFRVFFGGLAKELGVSPQALLDAMTDLVKHSGQARPLLVSKLYQAFEIPALNEEETPMSLTQQLEAWTRLVRDAPKGGWPLGPKYEAKAKSQRLKLIADVQRKGRAQTLEPEKKRSF